MSGIRLAYLIGQYPAINHGYLLAEVGHLREMGFEVRVASIALPDRPPEQLSAAELEEAASAFYLKAVPVLAVAMAHLAEALSHPWRYLRGLLLALRLAGPGARRIVYHLAYFAEAVLVGRWMRRCGVSHVHASFTATVALITARAFGVTMSFDIHGYGELHDPVGTRLTDRIGGATFVRSISRQGRGQAMLSCDRDQWSKLEYAPLGIDPVAFAPRPFREEPSPLELLCVGRLAPEKGQIFLIEVVARLVADGLSVRLHLAGDGPDRGWLQREAAARGVSAHVIFEGWLGRDKLIALYGQTDVFVLASLYEGIPMVLMEAMAMEIPCVAPRITGIPELIEHEVDGLLFAVADVDALTCAVRRLAEAPARRRELGTRARGRVVRDYDMAVNTGRFATVLQNWLGAG
jgi:colanic acid/amylovoran biosynthesis glycosyltransferase